MFDSLIESRRQKTRSRPWASVPISLAIHVVVLGSGVVATLWAVDELPEPPIPVTFYATVPPPAPPPGKPSTPKQQQPRKQETPPPVTQINTIPIDVPVEKSEPEVQEGRGGDGDENGVEGGIGKGPVTRLLGGNVPPADEVTPPPKKELPIIRPGAGLSEPRRVYDVTPAYPAVARAARKEGDVILETIVDRQGAVRDIRVLRGQPLGMTEAAIDAVRQWRYEPSFLNGQPVEVYVIVTVHFRLR